MHDFLPSQHILKINPFLTAVNQFDKCYRNIANFCGNHNVEQLIMHYCGKFHVVSFQDKLIINF